jgi:hypothetical protein
LDGDGMQFAGARRNEGHFARLVRFFFDLKTISFPSGLPQTGYRRMKKFLPGMWTDSVAEHCLIVSLFQPVGTAILFVGPAHWQVGSNPQFVIDDGSVANCRSYYLVTPLDQAVQKLLKVFDLQCELADTFAHSGPGHQMCLNLISLIKDRLAGLDKLVFATGLLDPPRL